MNTLLINLFIGLLIIKSYCQDIIFPSDEEVTHLSGNKMLDTDRIPLSNPIACPKNMLQYPGDGVKSVWVCDCRPTYLYFPLNDTCHEAFRQGPCKVGEYVVLPPGNVTPKCQKNPCHHDGMVPYNGTCHNLRMTGGPCGDNVLGVNETTYQLECITTDIAPFIIIDAPLIDSCPPGSRRITVGDCKPVL
ncbi:hypothetical protein HCN44_011476 [Aphidius gifuensis]|uniref:DUF4789 domain-containing protein n=1 Tax=Aphidius gifuensis TaxID=684658 RepID=A0A835CNL1_APHGI|nr:uncharacterized protein LOC122860074 [Aphidius gifuensis]KAF7987170.1 hypothetical protein HCN44_011476 [Aphidius gifuensis]